MGFRKHGSKDVPEAARGVFLEALKSGLSQSAAATVAGVSHQTGSKWARSAGIAADLRHCGIRYPAPVREAFWAAMASGSSVVEASMIAGVSENTGQTWVKQAGYVPRTPALAIVEIERSRRPRAPLTFVERCRLEDLLEQGYSQVEAAEKLGRHRDTIRREIVKGLTGSGYRARAGQDTADENRRRTYQGQGTGQGDVLNESLGRNR